jgi:2-oxoglutarate/2-oxoacid ferredoxin oxidoreductase subunit alpha
MKVNILIGGKAGQGPNILTQLIGDALVNLGCYVFYSRNYESLIRGGHNFNVISFSEEEIYSNESKINILVCLDENTEKLHSKELDKNSIVLKGNNENMHFAGRLFKILGIDFKILEEELKKLKNIEENLKNAKEGYDSEKKIYNLSSKKNNNYFINGSQGISEGAIKSGLDIYYAYPMTPATPVLFELAGKQKENNFLTLELENEIAVINSAVGSAITGAKSMIGTAGGGFDLMTEALSMIGQAEIPLVIYLAQRPGPGTGLATYTSQGDLKMALNSGHGEFSRMVIAPGDPLECEELTSQAFYFSQKFKMPCIILSDKHLAESFYTLSENPKIQKSEKFTELIRYNSYEHNSTGEAIEDAETTKKNFEARLKKQKEIEKEAEKFDNFKVHGKKQSKNIIVSFGSTKGVILDSIKDLDVKFIQILYIEPFPIKIKQEIEKASKIISIENNATAPLADLIREKTGMEIKNKILRYDGRPFLSDELKEEIKKYLK